jgi:hypothetical protein
LRVRCQERILAGEQLELLFATHAGDAEIQLRVEVRHVDLHQSSAGEVWEAGCEFREIPQTTQEQLLNFLVEQQAAVTARATDTPAGPSRPIWASPSVTIAPEFIGSR